MYLELTNGTTCCLWSDLGNLLIIDIIILIILNPYFSFFPFFIRRIISYMVFTTTNSTITLSRVQSQSQLAWIISCRYHGYFVGFMLSLWSGYCDGFRDGPSKGQAAPAGAWPVLIPVLQPWQYIFCVFFYRKKEGWKWGRGKGKELIMIV